MGGQLYEPRYFGARTKAGPMISYTLHRLGHETRLGETRRDRDETIFKLARREKSRRRKKVARRDRDETWKIGGETRRDEK